MKFNLPRLLENKKKTQIAIEKSWYCAHIIIYIDKTKKVL